MVTKSPKLNYSELKWIGANQKRFGNNRFQLDYSNYFLANNTDCGNSTKNLLSIELWWYLLPYLTLMDKLRLTYVKKELYFIILSNKNFQKEFNVVKSITKNSDWNTFLYLKYDEVLNKFKSKLYCRENMYSYINCYFLFFPMKNNLSMKQNYSPLKYI